MIKNTYVRHIGTLYIRQGIRTLVGTYLLFFDFISSSVDTKYNFKLY